MIILLNCTYMHKLCNYYNISKFMSSRDHTPPTKMNLYYPPSKKRKSYLTEIKYGGTVFSSVPPYLYSSVFSLLFTYLYFCVFSSNVSVTLSLNSLILSSIPGSFIAAPALFAVSIIQKLPGR